MKKQFGQVFTPQHIVQQMLDHVGFTEDNDTILSQRIMEPSFGQGVFLIEISRRIVTAGKRNGWTEPQILEHLRDNLHGIELDENLYTEGVRALNALCETEGLGESFDWPGLHHGNALHFRDSLSGQFNLVIGNPPYVRIHNIPAEERAVLKDFTLTTGTTDLYIAFFELGIGFLAPNGRLAYITPNTFMKNASQKAFRAFVINHNLLDGLTDYRSEKIFSDADTYASITYLTQRQGSNPDTERFVDYLLLESGQKFQNRVPVKDLASPAGSAWNLADPQGVMLTQRSRTRSLGDVAFVMNGLGTHQNNVFIDSHPTDSELENGLRLFNGSRVEPEILRPVVKISTYKGEPITSLALFPYKKVEGRYMPLSEDELSQRYPKAYAYLLTHKDALEGRVMEDSATRWYQYGRSQGLTMIDEEKVTLGLVIKPGHRAQAHVVPAGTLAYSGFVTAPKPDSGYSIEDILTLYRSEEFSQYANIVGKDMSGGYTALSAPQAKAYRID